MQTYLLSKVIYFLIFNIIANNEYVFGLRNGFNYEHNRQELQTTKSVRIGQNKCQSNELQVFVHSAASAYGKYFDRRTTTRDTWAKEAKDNHIRVTFVLGEPKDQSIQRQLLNESNRFGDILQFGFIDDYHNLTLKSISLLRWISINCLVNDYIIKTDDDIIVNIKRLKELVDNKSFKTGITGKKFTNSKPYRDIDNEFANKWLVPKEVYNKDYYPPYLSGAAYVMSTNIVEKLYNSSLNYLGPVLQIDDLYITGIIAKKFNIPIHNSPEFAWSSSSDDPEYCGFDVCGIYSICTLHGCDSVNSTLNLWNKWKNSSLDSCRHSIHVFIKLHKTSSIIVLIFIILFIITMTAMLWKCFAKHRVLEWHKVDTNA